MLNCGVVAPAHTPGLAGVAARQRPKAPQWSQPAPVGGSDRSPPIASTLSTCYACLSPAPTARASLAIRRLRRQTRPRRRRQRQARTTSWSPSCAPSCWASALVPSSRRPTCCSRPSPLRPRLGRRSWTCSPARQPSLHRCSFGTTSPHCERRGQAFTSMMAVTASTRAYHAVACTTPCPCTHPSTKPLCWPPAMLPQGRVGAAVRAGGHCHPVGAQAVP